jgi:hypothetical protein
MFESLLSSGSDTDEKLVVIVTLLSLVLDAFVRVSEDLIFDDRSGIAC